MSTIEAIPATFKFMNTRHPYSKTPAEVNKIKKSFETIMFDDNIHHEPSTYVDEESNDDGVSSDDHEENSFSSFSKESLSDFIVDQKPNRFSLLVDDDPDQEVPLIKELHPKTSIPSKQYTNDRMKYLLDDGSDDHEIPSPKKKKHAIKTFPKKSIKELIEEPDEKPIKKPIKEPIKKSIKEPIKDSIEVPIKEPIEVVSKEPIEVAIKEPIEEPTKIIIKDPIEEPIKILLRNPLRNPLKNLVRNSQTV